MGQHVATDRATGGIRGARVVADAVPDPFAGLDPTDAAFVLDAIGSQPVTEQRTRVLSYLTLRLLLCERAS